MLSEFLIERRRQLAGDGPLGAAIDELAALTGAGGKRLRPWFVAWGHRAAGREPDRRLVHVAAAVELVHTFALVQDDVIDRSRTRRGRAALHVALAAGDDHHGLSAALLASDLALVWADFLMLRSGYHGDELEAAFEVFNTLREEVTAGQFDDLALTGAKRHDERAALAVCLRKTAGYTVRRPLELGIVLGGGSRRLLDAAAAYATPAGIAFQLRDDLLGAFGDSSVTGKPDGDDLAQAKPTWLLARGLRAPGRAGAELGALIALPERGADEVSRMRSALLAAGAVRDAETMIARLAAEAEAAIARFEAAPELADELRAVTRRLVERDR